MTEAPPPPRARTEINLGALRANVRTLRARVTSHIRIMAVVKADAYGHGALRCT
ncbi:alanine racemase, partial [Streptomyces sp. NPDC006324]|uniref:alanine racemase n=1 Tax=Streptomyces sp. NPDC006324 TaxID=3156751 RepID=UPI0033A8E6FD